MRNFSTASNSQSNRLVLKHLLLPTIAAGLLAGWVLIHSMLPLILSMYGTSNSLIHSCFNAGLSS